MNLTAMLAVAACLAGPAPAGPELLKIGVPASVFRDVPPNFQQLAQRPLAELIQKMTGVKGEVVVIQNATDIPKMLDSGELQVGVLQGHELAWLAPKNPNLDVVVIADQFRSVPVQSYLFARADGPIARYEDADGKTFSLPKGVKDHTKLFLEKLHARKVCDFKAVKVTTDALDALDLIVDGESAAGVVDSVTWEAFKAISPARAAKLKQIESSDPFPPGAIVCKADSLSKEQMATIRKGLLGASDHRSASFLLNTMKLKGFVAAGPEYMSKLKEFRETYPAPKGWLDGKSPFESTSFQKK